MINREDVEATAEVEYGPDEKKPKYIFKLDLFALFRWLKRKHKKECKSNDYNR